MPFSSRNTYYLRITETSVLPLYVYLDERHLDWMSDRVLQHVLADLRPLIIPKLQAEADVHLGPGGPSNAKRGAVDVHKGDFYQFCFFFRKTEPHSVLVKSRIFFAAETTPINQVQRHQNPSASESSSGKRKSRNVNATEARSGRKKRKTKGKGKSRMTVDDDEISAILSDGSNHSVEEIDPDNQTTDTTHRSSRRSKELVSGARGQSDSDDHGADKEDEPSGPRAESFAIDLELEENETKPKLAFKLGYSNFVIYGRCLCVVVEPWPPLPNATRGPTVAGLPSMSLRAPSIVPSGSEADDGGARRAKTPLFLSELDRDVTPFSFPREMGFNVRGSTTTAQDDFSDGMIQFSQVLNSTGDFRAGVDDDEMDGAAFLGDADEAREL